MKVQPLTPSLLCKECLIILANIGALNKTRPLVLSEWMKSIVQLFGKIERYKGVDLAVALEPTINNDAFMLIIKIYDESVFQMVSSWELVQTIDSFTRRFLFPMLRRLPCAIAARQRDFKLKRMQRKSKARNWRLPWLNTGTMVARRRAGAFHA